MHSGYILDTFIMPDTSIESYPFTSVSTPQDTFSYAHTRQLHTLRLSGPLLVVGGRGVHLPLHLGVLQLLARSQLLAPSALQHCCCAKCAATIAHMLVASVPCFHRAPAAAELHICPHSLCCLLPVWPTTLRLGGNRELLGAVREVCAHCAVWSVQRPVSRLVLSVAISGDIATFALRQRLRANPPTMQARAAHSLVVHQQRTRVGGDSSERDRLQKSRSAAEDEARSTH